MNAREDEMSDDPEIQRAPDRSIEPGKPTLEHTAFVILGAVGTVLIFLRGLGVL